MNTNFSGLTDRLTSPDTGIEPALWLPLLHLLAQREPVAIGDLAAVTGGHRAGDPRRAGRGAGHRVRRGGTHHWAGPVPAPPPHRLELSGEQLYTWCALDTLIFPALLGTTARIESACHATGVPIRLSIGASGASGVEPATAVVSLINPEDMSSVRSAFCNHVHFFASDEAAQPWLAAHPSGSVVPVAEAHRIGTAMAGSLVDEILPTLPGCAC